QAVDVGCHRLQLAAMIGSVEFGDPRLQRHDDAALLVVGTPDDAVAGDQGRQVGAAVTASYLALWRAGRRFDVYLHPEVGDDLPFLFGAELATEQAFFGQIGAPGGAGAAFVLDFLNPPALASSEMSLGHVVCILRIRRSVARGAYTAAIWRHQHE